MFFQGLAFMVSSTTIKANNFLPMIEANNFLLATDLIKASFELEFQKLAFMVSSTLLRTSNSISRTHRNHIWYTQPHLT